jgi:sugar lactone lactonase YvrE
MVPTVDQGELLVVWRFTEEQRLMKPVEAIADYGDLCGECPTWSPRDQVLYWSDISGRKLYRYAWPAGTHEVHHEGVEVSGIANHASGGLVIVNSEGIWLWQADGKLHLVVDTVEGRKCALNDCIADPEGRLITGSCFFDPNSDDYDLGFLLRVEKDGTAQIVDEGIHLANGLGFSPDCSILYFADSAARIIYAYDYRKDDGAIRNRRVFARIPGDQGIPDGLTVDAEGFVWSAQWFGGCIVRYDPDGTEQQRIVIPASQSSSLTFGGQDLTDIFVTSASLLDALSLAPTNYRSDGGAVGGPLFHLNLGICGKPDYEARLQVDLT